MFKLSFALILLIFVFLKPASTLSLTTTDPNADLLQNRISKNFSKKFCRAVQNGLSKDEAMTSAIIKT